MKHYFATDGNYGDGSRLLMVDTTHWTEADWSNVSDAADSERREVAADIAREYKKVMMRNVRSHGMVKLKGGCMGVGNV